MRHRCHSTYVTDEQRGSVRGMRVSGPDGLGIEVFVEGPEDGNPVLFMHGWPDSHTLWRHQVAALSKAGYRTVTPDLRGFGDSEMAEDPKAYHVSNVVLDMVAILDQLGIDKANVVAHDWGAAAGWGLAAFVPDRVASYVAVSVGHPKAFFEAGLQQRMRSLYMLLFNLPEIAEEWFGMYGAEMLSAHRDRAAVLEALARPGRLTAGFGWYRANAHPRTVVKPPPELTAVTCPVMGIWGRGDVALCEAQMTGSQKYVEGPWRYERIEDAGHWMQLEVPDLLNDLLLDFLGSLPA
jgi:pimeloyl-ACP methyl ester carboxylesterase